MLLIPNQTFEVSSRLGFGQVTQQLTFLEFSPGGKMAVFVHPAPHTIKIATSCRPKKKPDGTFVMENDTKLGHVVALEYSYATKEVKTLSIPVINILKAVSVQ